MKGKGGALAFKILWEVALGSGGGFPTIWGCNNDCLPVGTSAVWSSSFQTWILLICGIGVLLPTLSSHKLPAGCSLVYVACAVDLCWTAAAVLRARWTHDSPQFILQAYPPEVPSLQWTQSCRIIVSDSARIWEILGTSLLHHLPRILLLKSLLTFNMGLTVCSEENVSGKT